ncbi:GNAT family N-acetyltransferase [Bradyrhizobium oligotrophicum]|uniref:GNAT family N-acetyltransferase n=1 Tax=Bradyrhizobium TaxID=374 RepID=UPI003EBF519D
MSIEIDVLNGDAAWPLVKPLYDAVWPPEVVAGLPWAGITFAHADLRVLVQDESGEVLCHVGIYRRLVKWNGQNVNVAGIGGVLTRPDMRNRGLATVGLNAAIQTLRHEDSINYAVLFCAADRIPFYTARGFIPFDGDVYAEQPEQGRIRFDRLSALVHDVKRTAPTRGTIDLCGLPW